MLKEKKTTDIRAVQAHQDVGEGAVYILQDLDEHERSSYEDYTTKGGVVVGEIYGEIHSNMAKVKPWYWFKKL